MKINKINWKKVLRVFLWIQGLLLLGLMLGYVNHIEQLQHYLMKKIQDKMNCRRSKVQQ